MTSTESVIINISQEEKKVIENLIKLLDDLIIPLSNDDYVSIFMAIAENDEYIDEIENLTISYE